MKILLVLLASMIATNAMALDKDAVRWKERPVSEAIHGLMFGNDNNTVIIFPSQGKKSDSAISLYNTSADSFSTFPISSQFMKYIVDFVPGEGQSVILKDSIEGTYNFDYKELRMTPVNGETYDIAKENNCVGWYHSKVLNFKISPENDLSLVNQKTGKSVWNFKRKLSEQERVNFSTYSKDGTKVLFEIRSFTAESDRCPGTRTINPMTGEVDCTHSAWLFDMKTGAFRPFSVGDEGLPILSSFGHYVLSTKRVPGKAAEKSAGLPLCRGNVIPNLITDELECKPPGWVYPIMTDSEINWLRKNVIKKEILPIVDTDQGSVEIWDTENNSVYKKDFLRRATAAAISCDEKYAAIGNGKLLTIIRLRK